MDCKQMREAMDLYVDGELSADATAAAGLHLSECAACRGIERKLLLLRGGVKAAVAQHQPPEELQLWAHNRFAVPTRRRWFPVFAVVALVVVMIGGVVQIPVARGFAASLLERFAFRLDSPRTVELEGRVICRDCELKRVYGADVIVASKGHGALETADGKIWNFMENTISGPLINDNSLQGKVVRIRGKIYRRAGCVEVHSYEIVSSGKYS